MWQFLLVYIDNTDLRKMIGCIGDDISTRNIIRQVIYEDIEDITRPLGDTKFFFEC